MDVIPGVIATVRVQVLSVDNVAGTASIEVIDANQAGIAGPATLPIGVITPIQIPINVHDVLRNTENGLTAVVEWIDPTNAFNWSASANGFNPFSSLGWTKIGTFNG
jgi:hypothetical protein